LQLKRLDHENITNCIEHCIAFDSGNSFAAPYQTCSEQQQQQLIDQFKLVNQRFANTDAENISKLYPFRQCNKIHLIAIINIDYL
jgi:hypothetical protein